MTELLAVRFNDATYRLPAGVIFMLTSLVLAVVFAVLGVLHLFPPLLFSVFTIGASAVMLFWSFRDSDAFVVTVELHPDGK